MPKDTPLCAAVTNEDVLGVKQLLLNLDMDVNWCTSKGKTALYLACRNKNKYIITLLFRHPKIDINFKKIGCKTAFTVAVETGDSDIIQMFLKDYRFSKQQHLKSLGINSKEFDPLIYKLLFAHELMDYTYISPTTNFLFNTAAREFYQQRTENRQQSILLNQTEFRIKQKLAAEVHTLVVCVSDDYFVLKTVSDDNSDVNAYRFFCITTMLPMEIQMLICNRVARSMRNNILSSDFNHALKYALL